MATKGHKLWTTTTVTEPRHCDFCKQEGVKTKAYADGKTGFGPWASMCRTHFDTYGTGLGLGVGQRYIYAK